MIVGVTRHMLPHLSGVPHQIVRARSNWPRDVFAWEYVNMCRVKMICSSRANHTNIAFLENYCYFVVYKQFICKR